MSNLRPWRNVNLDPPLTNVIIDVTCGDMGVPTFPPIVVGIATFCDICFYVFCGRAHCVFFLDPTFSGKATVLGREI